LETEELSNTNKKLKEQYDTQKQNNEKVLNESKLTSESIREITDQNNKFQKENTDLILKLEQYDAKLNIKCQEIDN